MEMVERDSQLTALGAHLEAARRGDGRLVWVHGEAGAGKSMLVRRFCEQVRGARIVVGACDALDTPRPLGPVVDLVHLLGRGPDDAGHAPERERVLRRLLDELRSRSWVTLAVIEDAHWADGATLDALRHIGRRLHDLRALLVVTYRDDESGGVEALRGVVGDLSTAEGIAHLRVPPLSRAAVGALAHTVAPTEDIDVDALYRLTAGNPFFVTEVLAAPGPEVPPTVRDAVLARTARLPAGALEVIDAAAVVPTRVELWLLEALTDATEAAIDACVVGGVLRTAGPGAVAFRHELARRAIDESLPPARRTRLHARVAQLLLERHGDDVDSARVAYHAEQAGDAALACAHAVRAARRATEFRAHREVAAQYERALRCGEGLDDADRAELLEEYALACRQVDRVDEARQAAGEAVALRRRLGAPRELGRALIVQSRAMWSSGDGSRAQELIGEAVRVLEALEPGPELAEAYVGTAAFAMLARDHDTAIHWGRLAATLARRIRATETQAYALNVIGAARLVFGDTGGAEDLRQSLAVARELDDDGLIALGWVNLGSGAGEIRDYATAEPALREGVAMTASRDLDARHHYLTAWLARVRFERGAWDEARTLLAQLPLDDPRIAAPSRIVALGVLGRLHARRGDADPVPMLEEARDLAEQTGDIQRLWPIASAMAEIAWFAGETESIPALVDDAFELARDRGLAWALGELALWRRRAGIEEPMPEAAATPWALHLGGRLREAAAAWDELGCPYEAADALADSEDSSDLETSLALLDGLGATRPAARVRQRLRERGVRGIPRGPRPATAAHPAGLTPRQAEVLDLLALGLADAEIGRRLHISTKTVGHHVSAILERLEARSRGEAVHAARDLGALPRDGDGTTAT